MSSDIWNPWHGCRKYSEGCENCYMFYLDKQREKDGISFSFFGTGNVFVKDGKEYHICKAYQHMQALRFGLQHPSVDGEIPIQKRCASCSRRNVCNGCRWCGKCKTY